MFPANYTLHGDNFLLNVLHWALQQRPEKAEDLSDRHNYPVGRHLPLEAASSVAIFV